MPDLSDNQNSVAGSFQPYTPPPGAPLPISPSPRKPGSSALKIILIVVGVFFALGVIGAGIVGYGVYRFSKSVHKDANGQITMNTPFGAVHTVPSATLTESDLGIAIYPGAEPDKNGVRMDMGGKTMITGNFLTSDSQDKVIAFYKDKAGPSAGLITTADGMEISQPNGAESSVGIRIRQSAGAEGGKTRIIIQHVFQNAASK